MDLQEENRVITLDVADWYKNVAYGIGIGFGIPIGNFLLEGSFLNSKKSFKFSKFWLLLSGTAVLLGKGKDKTLDFLSEIKEKVYHRLSTTDVQDTGTQTSPPGIYTYSVKACRQIRIRRITRFF